ncbi:LPS export ABC transporter periplasmic protein LptC [Stappia indica]|uniref:LPS export ABC transporter periplasmic protein LptC n=1 Tax=Stappia indica TaxID=538381 RepID=UPI001CD591F2|nr:LPS export ABC transporter periplasmic protein LptC [Stappia indica]MCA1299829.1 LPS export ABC transporter periplasmic protein LptC [Stappia indica]
MDQHASPLHAPNCDPAPDADPRRAGEMASAQRAARRHSRRVRLLRLVIPGLGFLLLLAIVGAVAVNSYLSSLGFGPISLTADGLVMDNPELSGHDGDRSYRVSADRAIQRISDPRMIDLERIVADLRLSAEQQVALRAARGTYNSGAETLDLADGIDVETNTGEKARFGSLRIFLDSGRIDTDDAATFTSSFGSLRAARMRFNQETGTLTFSDGISMTVIPPNQESKR